MLEQNSKEQFCLPVANPIITSYMSYAPALSILSYYSTCDNWIYNNFINMYGEYSKTGLNTLRFQPQFTVAPKNPFLGLYIAPKDIMLHNYNSVIDYIICAITKGYYICTDYDKYYVEFTDYYKKENRKHQIFIYGYDKINSLFYTAEFFNNRHYSFQKVPFTQIENSVMQYDSTEPIGIWISMFEFYNASYDFDYPLFLVSMKDYLNSESSTIDWEDTMFCKKNQVICGIKNYDYIINYLNRLKNGEELYEDIRAFHVLCDHKSLMVKRLGFLKKNKIADFDESILEVFAKVEQSCLVNRSLFLKYQISHKADILPKMIENIKNIQENERAALMKLLQ